MTAGSWEQAVREQVGLGRLLPLGAAADGAWIAERAAAGVLRRAAAEVRGARVTALRVGLAEGAWSRAEPAAGPTVGPPPVSALPYGELRIAAECDAATDRPMTATADTLREVLRRGAEARLGLRVAAVDIHVAGLLEAPQNAAEADGTDGTAATRPGHGAPPGPPGPPAPGGPAGGRPAGAPDVPGLLDADVRTDGAHTEVRAVTDAGYRALDVAVGVRARMTAAPLPGVAAATVTVLITDIR